VPITIEPAEVSELPRVAQILHYTKNCIGLCLHKHFGTAGRCQVTIGALSVVEVSVPCASCSGSIRIGDDFCQSCGASVSRDLKAALERRLEASSYTMSQSAKRVREASHVIIGLCVLFVISGIVLYFVQQSKAADALSNLSALSDDMLVPETSGATARTVAELRKQIEIEPYLTLALNLVLGAMMLGLYFWSRRSALPAIMTAFAVYIVVQIGNALFEPQTIFQGVFIKIIVIIALIKGLRAALAARQLGIGSA
jgi:hypothetical protein